MPVISTKLKLELEVLVFNFDVRVNRVFLQHVYSDELFSYSEPLSEIKNVQFNAPHGIGV
jgi:hypothetical protein